MSPDGALLVVRALLGNAIERWVYVLQAVHDAPRRVCDVQLPPLGFASAALWHRIATENADELLLGLTLAGIPDAWSVLQSSRRAA